MSIITPFGKKMGGLISRVCHIYIFWDDEIIRRAKSSNCVARFIIDDLHIYVVEI